MAHRKHEIMVLVAASTVNTGPVKGILQFIKNVKDPNVHFHLFNFSRRDAPVPDPFERDTLEQGVTCKFIRLGRHNYPLMVLDTVRSVKKYGITIIQTHGFKPSFLGFCAKIFCGTKWVCFMHGETYENAKVRCYNFIDNCLQQFADVTVLVSENQRRRLFGGKNLERVQVLHNAVALSQPVKISSNNLTIRQRYGIDQGAKVVVVAGRLSPEKGVDVFLRSMQKVLQKYSCVQALIVGDGQEKESLLSLALTLGIEKKIHFTGFTNTPGDYMLEADIIILPSRSEGIPNVALEAMALGKPLIATAVGGTPEVVEHEKSGLLVPSDHPEFLAEAIIRICNDPKLVNRLREGAQSRVRKHFSVTNRCRKLVELYSSLL